MADERCIDDMVRDLVKGGIDADADGKVEFDEVVKFGGSCLAAGVHVIADLRDRDKFDELATACESLFDEYVGPLDIKAIPNYIEPVAKTLARGLIRQGLAQVYDYLDKAA